MSKIIDEKMNDISNFFLFFFFFLCLAGTRNVYSGICFHLTSNVWVFFFYKLTSKLAVDIMMPHRALNSASDKTF